MDIDERINMRAEQKKKAEPIAQKMAPIPHINWSPSDIFSTMLTGTVPHSGPHSKPKESAMRTDAQVKMLDRVSKVSYDASHNIFKEHHMIADPLPDTVQGIMDAMANGTFRLIAGVKPTDKTCIHDSMNDYFEFRTVDADEEGYKQAEKTLEFDKTRVYDSILANPNPEKAFEDFQAFLAKWEPNPTQKAN
jgi:hypothetical protein